MVRLPCACFAIALAAGPLFLSSFAAPRPNILWIVSEDINPHLRCYGDTNAVTPELDRFAQRGLRYANCWSVAPVCAPARTALISGVYPTSTGAEHMRSLVRIPPKLKTYPELMRQAGYYCVNNAKEDYNIAGTAKIWDESSRTAHWKNRKAGQPFLAVFNLETTHESQIRKRPHNLRHDPTLIGLPRYHPDTPEVRHDWAQYYDNITTMDGQFAARLAELERAGLADETIVFFYGDNGSGMPRSKRWPYNSGLNVPLIIHVPDRFRNLAPPEYRPGSQTDRLVSFVDFAPTLLSLAGADIPDWIQGKAFLGKAATAPRQYLFGQRGRMDERYDMVRSVRDQRYIYIRNYLPHLIYGQYLAYMFETPTTRVWKQLYDEGRLRPPQTFFWESKPPEELYDLQSDTDEVRNLAGLHEHASTLRRLRGALREHMLEVRDTGLIPEAERHRQTQDVSAYEFAADESRFPLKRVLDAAESASRADLASPEQLRDGLSDPEATVRYWSVVGLMLRGPSAVKAEGVALRTAFEDASPSVRIAAAFAIAQHGDTKDLESALRTLQSLAAPDRNGAFVSLEALNAIEALGQKAASLRPALKEIAKEDPTVPARARGYNQRILDTLE